MLKEGDHTGSNEKMRRNFHFTLVRMAINKTLQTVNAGEGVGKREPSYTVGGNVNWYSHYGGQYGGSLKTLKTEPSYDPSIPLLGMYPEKNTI